MIHELGTFVFDTLNLDLLIPVDNFMDFPTEFWPMSVGWLHAIFPGFWLVVQFLQMALLDTVLDIKYRLS